VNVSVAIFFFRGMQMAHSEFGCEFEIGNATRFFGLEGKTEVFCLG
jgi:hypothetical protein